MTEQDLKVKELEKEVKLHINVILYEQGYITERMFLYAQSIFQSTKQVVMV